MIAARRLQWGWTTWTVAATVAALSNANAWAGACSGGTTGGSQADRYCQGSQASEDAGNTNTVLAAVHAGASATCLSACQLTWAGGDSWCTASSIGAAITDIASGNALSASFTQLTDKAVDHLLAEDTATSATQIGATQATVATAGSNGAGAGAAASGAQGAQKTAPMTKQERKQACVQGVVEGVTSAMKFAAASDANNAAKSNESAAEQVKAGSDLPTYNTSAVGGANSSAATGSGLARGVSGSSGNSNNPCKIGATTGNYAAVTQCAMASGDSRAIQLLKDPKFAESILKTTGMSPSDFFAKAAKEGSGAISSSVSGPLGAERAMAAGSLISSLSSYALSNRAPDAGYAGSGGGKRAPASASGKNFNDALADMMAKLQQKPEEDKKDENNLAFAFKGERYPANVAENRSVSLFERVTFRYYSVSPRLITGSKSPSN